MALYNLKNPAVKRLMKEAEELRFPTEEYSAQPLEDNLFEWHFTLRGPPNTEFDGGIYHGRITLPPEYPMKPPSIILLTPNGRFEVNKKICLSISGHHPETWQPSWSIRTALLAIIGFLPTHGNGAIGSLDYTPEERKHLAVKSRNWKCSECGYIKDFLKNDVKSSEKNTEVLDMKSQKESKITEPLSSETAGEDVKRQNQSVSETDSVQSSSIKNHVDIPHVANLAEISLREETFPRQRHLNSNQETDVFESVQLVEAETVKSEEIKSVKPDEDNCISSYFSLFMIWVIVIILVILSGRRLLYQ